MLAARSPDDARNELRKLQPMREHGYELPDDIVTGDELHELEPALSEKVRAGFQIREHWHVRPDSITAGLADVLRRDGVDVREGAEVVELVQQGDRLTTVRTAAGDLEADVVVLAAGAWTTELARSLGIALPMEPGKGYSFYARPEVVPSHAILLADVHVGCTPYGERIRIGGTMEFSGVNTRLDRRRIASIVTGAKESFVPWKSPEIEAKWAGMRPIPADGLPIVDRFGSFGDTWDVTTGHADAGRAPLAPPRDTRWPRPTRPSAGRRCWSRSGSTASRASRCDGTGVDIRWVHAGMAEAELPPASFDLVSAQYPALLRTPDAAAERALLGAVAPGGVLLLVHHAGMDSQQAPDNGFDPADYVWPPMVTALLDDNWVIELDEQRPRVVPDGGAGAHHTDDLVLRARRLR